MEFRLRGKRGRRHSDKAVEGQDVQTWGAQPRKEHSPIASEYARAASEYDPFASSRLPSWAASDAVRPSSASAGAARARRESVSAPNRMAVLRMRGVERE